MTGRQAGNGTGGFSPALLIFDCDGTLVESEALESQIQAAHLAAHGLAISPSEIVERFSGVPPDRLAQMLPRATGITLPDDAFDRIAAEFEQRLDVDLTTTPGARAFLNGTALPFCVASNSPRTKLIRMLRTTGLLALIGPRFFSAEDVGRRKPAPDVLLLAAEIMGVSPGDCLVVEDSEVGIRAAQAAGMPVVAFLGGRHHSRAMKARLLAMRPDFTVADMRDLAAVLT